MELGLAFFSSTVAMIFAFYIGILAMGKNVTGYEYAFLCGICFAVLDLFAIYYIIKKPDIIEGEKE